MDPDKGFFGRLRDDLLAYGRTRLELAKLEAAEKVARIVAFLLSLVLMLFLFMLLLIFAGIATAHYVAGLTGSLAMGYATVSGAWLLLLLLVYVFRKKLLERPVMNKVIGLLCR